MNDIESNGPDKDQSIELASIALKSKRLSLAWLDGEVQKVHIFFPFHIFLLLSMLCGSIKITQMSCIEIGNKDGRELIHVKLYILAIGVSITWIIFVLV